jgi:uncharacterized protein with HEPN domain
MTNKDELRVPDYLDHILVAIGRIQKYTAGMTEAAFLHDEKTHDAVVRNIEIIGEASKNIRDADARFATDHPDIPWSLMYRMRNALSHGYYDVDVEVVWRTIKDDLPGLERQIKELRASF